MRHLAIIAVLLALLAFALSAFTVTEREYAAKFRLGKIVETEFEPGLHFRVPIMHTVKKFDNRILSLEGSSQRFITGEKKDVMVDSFVKWRIADVRDYYTATGSGQEERARARLAQIIADGLRAEFAKRTLSEVISTEREEIMETLRASANRAAASLGIEIVDVRIKQIDLPEEVEASVFERMRAERSEVANALRSEGNAASEKIRAEADRTVQVMLAEADREAEQTRGAGDAKAAELYAIAYQQDPDFYKFFRSLQAYRKAFESGQDVMLLDADSEFFSFFREQQAPEQ